MEIGLEVACQSLLRIGQHRSTGPKNRWAEVSVRDQASEYLLSFGGQATFSFMNSWPGSTRAAIRMHPSSRKVTRIALMNDSPWRLCAGALNKDRNSVV